MDFNLLESVFKCKIPFEMNYTSHERARSDMKLDNMSQSLDSLTNGALKALGKLPGPNDSDNININLNFCVAYAFWV